MAHEKDVVMHTWCVQQNWNAPTIVSGKGAVFQDEHGQTYLDMSSLAESNHLGHQHPRIVEAIKKQADELCFITSEWGAKSRADLAEKLLEVSGFKNGRVFFTLGGADANENAVKFARWASGKPNGKVITRYRSYHGASPATSAMSGDPRSIHQAQGMNGVVHVPPPYCYRCPMGLQYGSCHTRCATYIEDVLNWESPASVAAVVMEPSAGTNGIIAPPEYWKTLRAITRKHNIPLIADEVMSGFGRTGQWFAWQHFGEENQPDMMTLAKGLTGAHLPLGAVVVSEAICKKLDTQMLYTGLTYGGHPLCCAAGLAAVESYQEENLIERSRVLGGYLKQRLQAMKERLDIIGDIRGDGLFAVIELIGNKTTKEALVPWGVNSSLLRNLVDKGRAKGVSFATRSNLIILAPPLVITQDQLDVALDLLEQLVEDCETHIFGLPEAV
ncbi:aminotransferase family protein [Leeia oryzae]|uniref:aminotransferase family protein n=1 Tax=Leeia oryzae TaxID=356662 RepID=UPI0003A6C6F4|nr:aminotransferase class III-fold pyridoxal phosphate-dependent enzyme [Leeia oryzae]